MKIIASLLALCLLACGGSPDSTAPTFVKGIVGDYKLATWDATPLPVLMGSLPDSTFMSSGTLNVRADGTYELTGNIEEEATIGRLTAIPYTLAGAYTKTGMFYMFSDARGGANPGYMRGDSLAINFLGGDGIFVRVR